MTWSILLALWACGDSDKETTDSGVSDTAQEDENGIATFLYVEETPVGDMSCFAEGYQEQWVMQTPIEDISSDISVNATAVDFETDEPVPDATIELYSANTVYGAPDGTYTSDGAGALTATVPTCSPYSYRVSTDPDIGLTKVTIKANQIEGADASTAEFTSVSLDTYNVIPALLGVSPDIDKGIVAGTAYDCAGEKLEFSQIIVTDADGNIPDSLVVRYFIDDFPSRLQEWTSEDGLFVAINVPEGDWFVKMYVSDGAGGHVQMAESPVKVFADSINISSVYTSLGDGIAYPSNCIEAPSE